MTQTSETGAAKTPWWKYLLKYGVPLVITVGLCYTLFSSIDFGEMMDIIKRDCDFKWIGIALGVSIISHIFRALRWRMQLKALNIDVPVTPVVMSIFGTYAVNLVFPRLGEVWRCGYIASRQSAPFTTVFGSMVADRLADTVTVALLTLTTFLLAGAQLMQYISQNPGTLEGVEAMVKSPWTYVAVAVCIAAVVAFFKAPTRNSLILKLRGWVKDLWVGFAVVAKMKGLGWWLLLTVAIWGCYFYQLYVAFFAFQFTTEVVFNYGYVAVLVCFVLSSIAMGVPSNGGIGPWQYAIMFGLSFYTVGGIDNPQSIAFANLVLGSQTLLLIVLGVLTFIYVALSKKRAENGLKGHWR